MNKHFKKKIGLGAAAALVGQSAHAEVPAEALAAVTGLITDAATFIASFWPLAIAVTVGFLWFTLFKKGTSKAT